MVDLKLHVTLWCHDLRIAADQQVLTAVSGAHPGLKNFCEDHKVLISKPAGKIFSNNPTSSLVLVDQVILRVYTMVLTSWSHPIGLRFSCVWFAKPSQAALGPARPKMMLLAERSKNGQQPAATINHKRFVMIDSKIMASKIQKSWLLMVVVLFRGW